MTIRNCVTCQISEDNQFDECQKCTGPDWPNWSSGSEARIDIIGQNGNDGLHYLDPNVESVRKRLADRAAAGLLKYGVDTTRTDLTRVQWLRHAQEEALDFAVYLERIIQDETGGSLRGPARAQS